MARVLQTLAELEQTTESQTSALQNLKRVAPVLSVGRSLLIEIKAHRLEMETTLATLTALWCKDSSVAKQLKQQLMSKLEENIEGSRCMEGELTNASASGTPITNRKVIGVDKPSKVLDWVRYTLLTLAADKQFIRSLQNCNSFLQRSLFQVLVQDCLDHSTRRSSNFRLLTLKEDFTKTMGSKLSATDEEFLKCFPTDIRTARKLLGTPKTVIYACCPACSSIYPPKDEDGIPTYPYECTSEPCHIQGGCNLLKLGSTRDGKSIGVPKRPFVIQDFHDFVGCLLSRPGVESAIQQSGEHARNNTLQDFITADGIKAIKGPNGTPFISGGQDKELRLLWCLSVDFFNPYHNKTAGKVASVGSIVLSCPLLPLDIRNRPENLCLFGIIPGPREPSGHEIDHFLRPLVNIMKESWADGAIYRTHEYPNGRLVRSAIALSVNDLPMARKIMGVASYIHKDITKENIDSWTGRTLQSVQADAQRWLNATSPKERKRLYNKTGVRHSVLMELEYWDPTSMVPVDGMHIFFLGLLQYHARTVLGMDSAGSRNEKVKGTTLKQLQNAREMLDRGGLSSATSDIIGEGIVQEIVQENMNVKLLLALGISQDDLKTIRDDIAATTRPRWQVAPPGNLGDVSHGKLKADEWRSCFEFDIPVSLLRIQTRRCASGRQTDEYSAKLVHSTFLLAIAIRWATSHRTSTKHAEKYTETIKAYLETLKDLQPNQRFRPNHFNALLIGRYLRLYGPVHTWWMFPFERVIGDLQRSSTNNKLGKRCLATAPTK